MNHARSHFLFLSHESKFLRGTGLCERERQQKCDFQIVANWIWPEEKKKKKESHVCVIGFQLITHTHTWFSSHDPLTSFDALVLPCPQLAPGANQWTIGVSQFLLLDVWDSMKPIWALRVTLTPSHNHSWTHDFEGGGPHKIGSQPPVAFSLNYMASSFWNNPIRASWWWLVSCAT